MKITTPKSYIIAFDYKEEEAIDNARKVLDNILYMMETYDCNVLSNNKGEEERNEISRSEIASCFYTLENLLDFDINHMEKSGS